MFPGGTVVSVIIINIKFKRRLKYMYHIMRVMIVKSLGCSLAMKTPALHISVAARNDVSQLSLLRPLVASHTSWSTTPITVPSWGLLLSQSTETSDATFRPSHRLTWWSSQTSFPTTDAMLFDWPLPKTSRAPKSNLKAGDTFFLISWLKNDITTLEN